MEDRKTQGAFRTIGELSAGLGVPQHVLRYWETRFPQLRPLQRAGNRRYYRPADVALAERIHRLLNHEGYTIRGVQKLLSARGGAAPEDETPAALQETAPAKAAASAGGSDMLADLTAIRGRLHDALAAAEG